MPTPAPATAEQLLHYTKTAYGDRPTVVQYHRYGSEWDESTGTLRSLQAQITIYPDKDKFTISVTWHGNPPIFREVEISKTGFAIEIDANIRANQ